MNMEERGMPYYEVETTKIFVEADDEEKAREILKNLIKCGDESVHVETCELDEEDVEDEDVFDESDVIEAQKLNESN